MAKKQPPKIGFLCGSLRTGSINQQLSKAIQKKAKAKGLKTGEINLATYDLPLYHGDLKTPAAVKKLISRMKSFDGVVIVTPEYNGGLPAVLKNAIDWTSTVETGHINGQIYGIASCTPGPMSGIMVMRELQFLLMRLGADLVPTQTGCGGAGKAFDKKGVLIAEPASTFADKMLDQMVARINAKR